MYLKMRGEIPKGHSKSQINKKRQKDTQQFTKHNLDQNYHLNKAK